MASEFNKPNGISILYEQDLESKIWSLSCRKINGIGPKAEAKLQAHGIHTISDLAAKDLDWLKSEFGKLLLQRKNNGSYETFLEENLPDKISIGATRWPSFSAFGFAAGGTITLETEYYITKVMVSPIGRIRQTEILKK